MSSEYTPEDLAHKAVLESLLEVLENVKNRDAKIVIGTQLFNSASKAASFLSRATAMENTLVTKCYRMKRENCRKEPLVAACDRLLAALDRPLVEPIGPEEALFISLARKHKELETVDEKYIREKYMLFRICGPRRRCSLERNMNTYIIRSWLMTYYWRGLKIREYFEQKRLEEKDGGYEKLMKSIAAKRGLALTDTVLASYHEWAKQFSGEKRLNRYEKMMKFADEHPQLFTSIQ